ncbi:RcpC/CpaB family pilus assembly protein [Streptomyces zhaozhouensis]|uniref:RcpC/CpaB family pilus assembly protein n=1 Tax=Streptomyces zhaozhouensis TaxID=1300267 RepID=UPI001FE5CFCB|nr:RcpC/CpaB family pilus assembly protein [Streptomyces zhaozhouensis]
MTGVSALACAAVLTSLSQGGSRGAPSEEPQVGGGAEGSGSPSAAPARRPPEPREVELPLRVADPGAVGLLAAGDRVDVYAAEGGRSEGAPGAVAGAEARLVARGARVVQVGAPSDTAEYGGVADGLGGWLVVSVDGETAAGLAGAAAASRLVVARW